MISRVVIRHLLHDKEYAKKVLPYLRPEYFRDPVDRAFYVAYDKFIGKYLAFPTPEAMAVLVDKSEAGLNDAEFSQAMGILQEGAPDPVDHTWLVDETEKYCRNTAVANAVVEAGLRLADNKDVGDIPGLLQSALAITFDNSIGHDYLEDAGERWDLYHETSERLPFDLALFNTVTRGGIPKKSLTVFMAGTGVGKTLLMAHMAAANLTMGKNVLYITLEMQSTGNASIAERIDANLLNVPVEDLVRLPKDLYLKKVESIKAKTTGKLIIEEYPAHSATVNHFRHLLAELKTKKGFVPDVIYLDYINLVLPARAKMMSGNMNSYTYVKMAAEEVRGLAMEFGTRIVTATQTNRSGFENSDPSLTDTAESFGLPQTADFYAALYRSPELEKLGQVMVVQLKNRWRDFTRDQRFVIGLDKVHLRFFDVEDRAQQGIVTPIKTQPEKTKAFAGFT